MLTVTVKSGGGVVIGGQVVVFAQPVSAERVKLNVSSPKDIRVLRFNDLDEDVEPRHKPAIIRKDLTPSQKRS